MLQSDCLTVAVDVLVGAPPSKWVEGEADKSAGRYVRRERWQWGPGEEAREMNVPLSSPENDDNGWKELSTCLGNVIGPSIAVAAKVGTAMGWVISEGEGSSRRRSARDLK